MKGFISSLIQAIQRTTASPPVVSHTPQEDYGRAIDLSNGWLRLSNPDFFGDAHVSANGRWALGCDDSDGHGSGGFREHGNGRVVLVDLKERRVVHELTHYQRPVDGAVSDTGSYVLHDSRFGSGLEADIIAVGLDGREQFRRHYEANVFNVAISQCGTYAAVQTANAPNDDGSRLSVLNIPEQAVLFSILPPGGWAIGYRFDTDEENRLVSLGTELRGLGWFNYSGAGEFLDEQGLLSAFIENRNYFAALSLIRDNIKCDSSDAAARTLLDTMDSVLRGAGLDEAGMADSAHRLRGELLEQLGRLPEALQAYENALAFNPKVGVKARAAKLRKMIGTS